MDLQPITVVGYDSQGGLVKNKKPFLNADQSWDRLENAYVWRQRVKKREGLRLMGRLTRILTGQSLGNTPAGPPATLTLNDIFTTISITGENPTLSPGTLVITVGAPDTATFTDNGDGTFSVTGAGVASGSYVNYITGKVVLHFTSLTGGAAVTAALNYYPGLPVMGIPSQVIPSISQENTVWFDTKYAYVWNGTTFHEWIPGTTWSGTDSDFFWAANYRGVNPQDQLFFVTNFFNDSGSPIRYTDGSSWTSFKPAVDGSNYLTQALILIPYFGRLLALNTWEGTAYNTAVNYFNRCRYSAIGNPVATNAWRSDIVGQGGFLDAPTNETIVGCTFLNNTLIVFFEETTWQLRYVGEYGVPFLWERVASDFGSESTFSTVLFNSRVLAVGNRAIIAADSNSVERIDLNIPDQIFYFQNQNNGVERVQGIRNYQKELVYWCYADSTTQAGPGTATTYPNRVLLYNYRNDTWAIFRDNVTAFGTFQPSGGVLWNSTTVYWDDQQVTWGDFDTQSLFPIIVSGNQQGFVHYYQYSGPQGTALLPIDEQPSLYITAVTTSSGVVSLTIPNHNLMAGQLIILTGLLFVNSSTFVPVTTSLNGQIFQVNPTGANTVSLSQYNFPLNAYFSDFVYTPTLSSSLYVGGGSAAILQNMALQTKDFNPFQNAGKQAKLSYVDFLMDVPQSPASIPLSGATEADPCVVTTSYNHGYFTGQQVLITGVQGMVQLNSSSPYRITVLSADTFSIGIDSTNYGTYVAGGSVQLLDAGVSVQIFLNSSPSITGNVIINNRELKTSQSAPFYGPASDYAWYRFYASCVGQYMRFLLTYDDLLMNTLTTHQQDFGLNAINIWVRPAGKINF